MNAGALVPPPETLPAPPEFFLGLGGLVFTIHLLLVASLLGTALIGLWRSLRPASPGLAAQAALMPGITAFAVNLAIPPLLFIQLLYGQFLYVGSTLMGVYWFGLVLAVMAAYALAYRQKYALAHGAGRGVAVWALLCLCLLYASLVQTHNALLLLRPSLWSGYFDAPGGTLLAWSDPTFLPRWLHFVLAALAMGGLVLAMQGQKLSRQADPDGPALTAEGLAWFSWATLAACADGLWFLIRLPVPVQLQLMGANLGATLLLAFGLCLAGITLVCGFTRRPMAAGVFAVLTVGVMVALREAVRLAYLIRPSPGRARSSPPRPALARPGASVPARQDFPTGC